MADLRRRLGTVVIGRNEGERLQRCLRSIPLGVPVVYVDSGSSDGSVSYARRQGSEVVELDLSIPFTAARARNKGFERLLASCPDLEFVQFVDGDCEFETGWLDVAAGALDDDVSLAAVCGRRRERYPDASFYNRLCDEEWNTPVGETRACGGDVAMRVSALRDVNGYDPQIIAGEEPEMCSRLRAAGWRIARLDAPMTVHDADMHSVRQWWLRAVRSGFGYAQVWQKTAAAGGEPLYVRELLRALTWTAGVPFFGLVLAVVVGPTGLLTVPLLWLALVVRLAGRLGFRKAAMLSAGKVAETWGATRYVLTILRRTRQGAIFYK